MVSFVDEVVREAASATATTELPEPLSSSPDRADATAQATPSGAPRPSVSAQGRRGKAGKAAKPAWALSPAAAEELEEAEEAELLAFAEELDLDGFLAALDDPDLPVGRPRFGLRRGGHQAIARFGKEAPLS
jgi:hypothetical protein